MVADDQALKELLEEQFRLYNRPEFIPDDPICIPHSFSLKQDQEIAGFFAAILAWGQRKTIINKCHELMDRMDGAPHEFILTHGPTDLKSLLGFKHRTFNDTDLLYFVAFLQHHYQNFDSLEDAFLIGWRKQEYRADYFDGSFDQAVRDDLSEKSQLYSPSCSLPEAAAEMKFTMETSLNHFKSYFFSLPDFPHRTRKHISSPVSKSTSKRLNMFLRWMVRKDQMGVDFGLWDRLKTSELICPFDVHVDRVARSLGLVQRKQSDWLTAVELTERLRTFDKNDPVKFDFALFGMGVSRVL